MRENRFASGHARPRSRFSAGLCLALCVLVTRACWATDPLPAELPDAPLPPGETQALEITILDGDGALNDIRQRTAREPIVQVTDHNHKPVAGVLVLFAINYGSSGAGATIGGVTSFRTVTDAEGRAQAHGLTPNDVEGQFTITVTATLGQIIATTIIHQENKILKAGGNPTSQQSTTASAPPANPVPPPAQPTPSHSKFHIIPKSTLGKVILGGIVVAGTIVTIVVVTKSGTEITPGKGTVGAP